ncbi:hypothetical protein [Streptomyces sp. Ag109_O5-10]|uniref:hypothetical protein n=1 Tax=Streptomyces sp. Ag109_O5-10 TaxID=1855349 RepID=UPI00089CBD98|nr:hypothetical protein [Streptomyces sp. Ag109_O5-10]SEF17589.1 hypothetical protein SAMN05216533_8410 [Streptomyces sp. Ag109_O5-10]
MQNKQPHGGDTEIGRMARVEGWDQATGTALVVDRTDEGTPKPHDTVAAYALAAGHPDGSTAWSLPSLLSRASASRRRPSAKWLNDRIWQIGFNRPATINELLVSGREDIFFGLELLTEWLGDGVSRVAVTRHRCHCGRLPPSDPARLRLWKWCTGSHLIRVFVPASE